MVFGFRRRGDAIIGGVIFDDDNEGSGGGFISNGFAFMLDGLSKNAPRLLVLLDELAGCGGKALNRADELDKVCL